MLYPPTRNRWWTCSLQSSKFSLSTWIGWGAEELTRTTHTKFLKQQGFSSFVCSCGVIPLINVAAKSTNDEQNLPWIWSSIQPRPHSSTVKLDPGKSFKLRGWRLHPWEEKSDWLTSSGYLYIPLLMASPWEAPPQGSPNLGIQMLHRGHKRRGDWMGRGTYICSEVNVGEGEIACKVFAG